MPKGRKVAGESVYLKGQLWGASSSVGMKWGVYFVPSEGSVQVYKYRNSKESENIGKHRTMRKNIRIMRTTKVRA